MIIFSYNRIIADMLFNNRITAGVLFSNVIEGSEFPTIDDWGLVYQ